MRHVIVRYTVKAGRADENEQLVRAVYDELHSTEPAGLSYATLKLDDGVSFVPIAATEDGRNPLADVAAFKQFQIGIAERCDEPPVVSEVEEIGSYRMFNA
jgi:hypothetical protein